MALPPLATQYDQNTDGSYQPFDTVPADSTRTAGGGFVDSTNPYLAATETGTTPVQQMQAMGVNPSLYGALSFGSYSQPEFSNVQPYDYSAGSNPLSGGVQNVTATNTNSVRDAYQAYLERLKNTEQERQAAAVQNQVPWNNMMIQSPVYNPNGANTYAIQHNTAPPPIPLITEKPLENLRENTDDTKVAVNNNVTNLAETASPNSYTSTGLSSTSNPQYNQFITSQKKALNGLYDASRVGNVGDTKVGSNRGPINFSRALWRN